jgi:hypothetical protein
LVCELHRGNVLLGLAIAAAITLLFRFRKLEQNMVLLSALEDFLSRTLGAIPSLLGRLHYLAGLRSGAHYQHWGLARIYGESAADDAIARAHTEAWLQVLRTPLPLLYRDIQQCPELLTERVGERDGARDFVPSNLAGGGKRHFSSILRALSALSAAEHANRPAA